MGHDEGEQCPCVADHNPNVMENVKHHIRPLYLGGADSAENTIFVCPTTHYNLHEIIRIVLSGQPPPANSTRLARELALEGIKRWREGTHGPAA